MCFSYTEQRRLIWFVFLEKQRFPLSTLDPRVTTGLTYEKLGLRPKFFVSTYDQVSSYNPRQCQRDEHISDITCSLLRALAVFALFCRRDHANSSYQSTV
jgi:hypothetical protein